MNWSNTSNKIHNILQELAEGRPFLADTPLKTNMTLENTHVQ